MKKLLNAFHITHYYLLMVLFFPKSLLLPTMAVIVIWERIERYGKEGDFHVVAKTCIKEI